MAEKNTSAIINSLNSELARLLITDPNSKRIAEIDKQLRQMAANNVTIIVEPQNPARGKGDTGKKITPERQGGDE